MTPVEVTIVGLVECAKCKKVLLIQEKLTEGEYFYCPQCGTYHVVDSVIVAESRLDIGEPLEAREIRVL